MGAMGYLYQRTLVNRFRSALHRPVTYVYLALIVFYFSVVPYSLRMMAETLGGNSPEGMAAVLTLLAFWLVPGNLIAYARRRGLVYRASDVHFLFPAPVGPKRILLYAYVRTLAMQILLNLFAAVCGGVIFQVELWRLAVYFFFSIFVENLLEGGIMLLLYGSERLGERQRGLIIKAAYAVEAMCVAIGIYYYLKEGLSLEMAVHFLNSDLVQMVPVAGWYIAVVHLLLLGASPVNIAGTVCYVLALAAVLAAAWRMKCTGAFYEDAMKFADDYEEVLASRRQGDIQRRLGRKRKFGKAHVRWKGHGARALFYRQLLEYKKSRYFIFDLNTAAAAVAGAGIAYLYLHEGGFGGFTPYVVPAVSAYVIFIFTAMGGKWAKELTSPYTYLIPDTPFRKLVNAMAMQHVQSLVNGCLITIPAAVVMKMPPFTALLCILLYMALYANKLYALAVAEIAVGDVLGKVGKQFFQMFIQGFVIAAAVLGGAVGAAFGGVTAAYVLMDVFLILFTLIFMVIAMLNFYRMETA